MTHKKCPKCDRGIEYTGHGLPRVCDRCGGGFMFWEDLDPAVQDDIEKRFNEWDWRTRFDAERESGRLRAKLYTDEQIEINKKKEIAAQ